MINYLTKKYRIIWDRTFNIIQNDYEKDCSGSTTILVTISSTAFFESDSYQDILDKIESEDLRTEPPFEDI